MRKIVFLVSFFGSAWGFGWGELGHQIIGRAAAQATAKASPALSGFFGPRWLQQGHLANMPDIYWRNLDDGLGEDGQRLGDDAHFLNAERFLDITSAAPAEFFKVPTPLTYAEAKVFFEAKKPGLKMYAAGSLPWRAAQLADLMRYTLEKYPAGDCKTLDALADHPTKILFSYAGILSHFTGDASQPYHVTLDYDGVATGQKGIHSFFETDAVNALESTLQAKVTARALVLLTAPASVPGSVAALHAKAAEVYGAANANNVAALVLAEIADSYAHIDEVRKLDREYAIATAEEAAQIPACHGKPVCRRSPYALVGKKTVAEWLAPVITERLAVAAALTAEIWMQVYAQGGKPKLCWTWQYALKSGFVSPTDERCFGYALKEDPKDFLRKDGKSALPWKKAAASTDACLVF